MPRSKGITSGKLWESLTSQQIGRLVSVYGDVTLDNYEFEAPVEEQLEMRVSKDFHRTANGRRPTGQQSG